MFAIPTALASALASQAAAIATPLIVLGALVLCALLAGGFAWLRARVRRRDQRCERALQRMTVAQVMEPARGGVPITMSLPELAQEYAASPEARSLHVTQWDQLVGMISRKDMRGISEEQWASARVGAAMTPLERVLTVEPDQSLLEAYRLMLHREVDHAPVVVRGRVVGMLNRETVRQLTAEQRPVRVKAADSRQRLPVTN